MPNTPILGLLLQATGTNDNTWGELLNSQVIELIEDAIAGIESFSMASGDVTLSATQARAAILVATGTLTDNRNIIVPNASKSWIVRNNTSGDYSVSVKTSSGSGVEVPQGGFCQVWCDGSNGCYASVASNAELGGGGGGGGSASEMEDGTAASPGLFFTSDSNTGIYKHGSDILGIAAGGAGILQVATTGISVTGFVTSSRPVLGPDGSLFGTVLAPAHSFTNDEDTGMYRVGPNNIGFSANGSKVLDITTTGISVTGTLSTSSNAAITGTATVTSQNTNALTVGRQGATNPALQVNSSTGSCVTGISITANTLGGGAAIAVTSSGANEGLSINAKGSGSITIGNISTGSVVISRAVTMTSTLAVTGAATLSSSLSVAGAVTVGSISASNISKAHGHATISGSSLTHRNGFNGTWARLGTGSYRFTFGSAMADTYYTATATALSSGSVRNARITTQDTSYVQVAVVNANGDTAEAEAINVTVYR